jgi:hypothetical protein
MVTIYREIRKRGNARRLAVAVLQEIGDRHNAFTSQLVKYHRDPVTGRLCVWVNVYNVYDRFGTVVSFDEVAAA